MAPNLLSHSPPDIQHFMPNLSFDNLAALDTRKFILLENIDMNKKKKKKNSYESAHTNSSHLQLN